MVDAVGGNSKELLKSYIEQANKHLDEIETLKVKHITPVRTILTDMYKKAKAEGLDPKAIKEVVRKQRLSKDTREQMDVYEHALTDLLD